MAGAAKLLKPAAKLCDDNVAPICSGSNAVKLQKLEQMLTA